jgi:hypothetical protein
VAPRGADLDVILDPGLRAPDYGRNTAKVRVATWPITVQEKSRPRISGKFTCL